MHPAFHKSIQRTASRKTMLTVIAKWRMSENLHLRFLAKELQVC